MTKRKIFVGLGSLILAVSAFFAVNANRKYLAATSAYFRTTTLSSFITLFKGITIPGGSIMNLTTTASSGHTAVFRSKGMTGDKTLYATKATTHPLYYK